MTTATATRLRRRAAIITAVLTITTALLSLNTSSATPAPTRTAVSWSPVKDLDGATGNRCTVAAAAHQALARLGETHANLIIRQQADIDQELPGDGYAGYFQPTPDGAGRIILTESTRTLPCQYVWATTAHEVAHVWQARATGQSDLYSALGRDGTEIVADCAANLTGWPDYRPYLRERATAGGSGECSPAELAQARELQGWAR